MAYTYTCASDGRGEGVPVIEKVSDNDLHKLRRYAAEVAEIAARPEQVEKARLWTEHNDLKTSRPVIFCDPEGGWNEIIPQSTLECEGRMARRWEWDLRKRIFWGTEMGDDTVIDNVFPVTYAFSDDGWGVNIEYEGAGRASAYHIKNVIEDYEENFDKLHVPHIKLDPEASEDYINEARRVFDGILTVERFHKWWWSLGLTRQYVDMRGLEDFMVDLKLEPEWVHRMMEMLCSGSLAKIDYLESQGLLCQNIGNHYVGSGGFGFTEQIKPVPFGQVTPMDMWGFVESQETVSISPEMYAEFVFPYHKRLAERFAMNCCGCCEPYDLRWKYMKELPRLRRISCSPWSDRKSMPVNLGMNYIASIKLNPAPLALHSMDEESARWELRCALENSVSCVPELIMKDNHTLGKNPRNAVRWVEIAREEMDRLSGL